MTSAIATSSDGTAISYVSLGVGPGLLVVGGTLRSAHNYRRLAEVLAESFRVHVIDRRGHGDSGAQGERYSIEREVDDLLAVAAQTGAGVVFGHSYGGLVALETARRNSTFSDVIVYEPGVSVGGSLPADWIPRFREHMAAGDARGAFATMVRGAGFAPKPLTRMPWWSAKLILRGAIRGEVWRDIEAHLPASIAEHEQVAAVDDGTVSRFTTISARTLLLGGAKSPTCITTELFDRLERAIPHATSQLIDGLDHTAPDEKAPEVVAGYVLRHLGG